jgi:alkylhydroperoxidase family enzyme
MLAAVQRDDPEGLATFDPAWAAALRFADAMQGDATDVSDALYAELAAHWAPEQVVEITMVIGLFAYFNRFNNALRVEVTR